MAEQAHDASQLWTVKRGQKQWSAWRSWLKAEFKYSFFPPLMTVVNEWPPATEDQARHVARIFNAMHEKAGKPLVNENPNPWRGS